MIAIGVTGHRFLTDLDSIRAGLDEALRRIEAAFPGQPLVAISSLAEGADRLVAEYVLARPAAGLLVPLPLPLPDYLTDFATAESRSDFMRLLGRAVEVIELPAASTRDAAYEAAGHYVVDHCDVLIGVWDGRTAQGRGGTGAIVARARRRGLPLAWVHAGNRRPGSQQPTSLGAEQGMVTFERL